MKKKLLLTGLLGLFFFISLKQLQAWGLWGHTHINRAAVFALPEPLRSFFFNHADYLTEESVVPDIRKYAMNDKAENPRHYIDLESFGNPDSIPRNMKDARAKYDSAFLQKNGILPWYIIQMTDKLTKAMKDGNKAEILFLAADLAHYVGDAHMPLHTALNHDGQLTNQKGIHAFWESQIPEWMGDQFNLHTAGAHFISDIQAETWRIILESHQLEDTLLQADRDLSASLPKDKIYQLDDQGKVVKTKFYQAYHTQYYCEQLEQRMHGMVEKQLQRSILDVASYWYTAWMNAGQPDLGSLDDAALTADNKPMLDKELNSWMTGKLIHLKTEYEFPRQ